MNIRDGGPIMKVINEAIRKQERERERRKDNETKKTAESGERLIHLVVNSECIKIAERREKRN